MIALAFVLFFFSSRRRHTRCSRDWSSDVCSSDLVGTAFQWKVWKALTQIPPGQTRSYGEIAKSIGEPTAARAVGRACATNQAAVVIPCHRAVGARGSLNGYRWGVARKERLLADERRRSST